MGKRKLRGRSMTLEQCAARMTAFLARPAKGKTRAYVATLPKRDKIKVSPADYASMFQPYEPRPFLACLNDPPTPTRKRKLRPKPVGGTLCLIERMIEAQLGRCVLCGQTLDADTDLHMSDPLRPSFDHVMPRARGGRDAGNRIAAHRKCNSDKGSRLPTGCELIWLSVVNLMLTPPQTRV